MCVCVRCVGGYVCIWWGVCGGPPPTCSSYGTAAACSSNRPSGCSWPAALIKSQELYKVAGRGARPASSTAWGSPWLMCNSWDLARVAQCWWGRAPCNGTGGLALLPALTCSSQDWAKVSGSGAKPAQLHCTGPLLLLAKSQELDLSHGEPHVLEMGLSHAPIALLRLHTPTNPSPGMGPELPLTLHPGLCTPTGPGPTLPSTPALHSHPDTASPSPAASSLLAVWSTAAGTGAGTTGGQGS